MKHKKNDNNEQNNNNLQSEVMNFISQLAEALETSCKVLNFIEETFFTFEQIFNSIGIKCKVLEFKIPQTPNAYVMLAFDEPLKDIMLVSELGSKFYSEDNKSITVWTEEVIADPQILTDLLDTMYRYISRLIRESDAEF